MRYRTCATPADALGLGDLISPEYAASLMSDAVSSATAACFDVSRFVSHVYVSHLYRGKIGTTVSQTSGAIGRRPCSSEPVREAAGIGRALG
jgi:hypothetical protein